MLLLNYYIHIILSHKYRLFFTIIIYILIYISIKNTHTVYCMTNEEALPIDSDSKAVLQTNIEAKTTLSNETTYYISSLSEKIKELELQIDKLEKNNGKLEDLLEESGYMNDMDGDDYNFDGWFRESDDDPRW